MQISITIDRDASNDDAVKAISIIGFFLGPQRMNEIAALMASSAGISPLAVAAAPVFPPGPPAGAFTAEAPLLDSTNLPWDERIHSGNKTKNQDGSWKARKGVDDATKASVTAELRQRFPTTVAAPPPPPAEQAAPPAAPPPPPPALEIPPSLDRRAEVAQPAAGALSFVDLMKKITGGITAGKLTQAQVVEACKNVGLENAAQLGAPANAHHIPAVGAYLDAVML